MCPIHVIYCVYKSPSYQHCDSNAYGKQLGSHSLFKVPCGSYVKTVPGCSGSRSGFYQSGKPSIMIFVQREGSHEPFGILLITFNSTFSHQLKLTSVLCSSVLWWNKTWCSLWFSMEIIWKIRQREWFYLNYQVQFMLSKMQWWMLNGFSAPMCIILGNNWYFSGAINHCHNIAFLI